MTTVCNGHSFRPLMLCLIESAYCMKIIVGSDFDFLPSLHWCVALSLSLRCALAVNSDVALGALS